MPLKVIVVGAGIGGLAVAIALRRGGHHVQIHERSTLSSEEGAAIVIGPNATKVLQTFGLDYRSARMTIGAYTSVINGRTLERTGTIDLSNWEAQWGAPRLFSHRADLHAALRDLAAGTEEIGTPVAIRMASKVVSYDSVEGLVTLSDGDVETADLVVAADGVHSSAPTFVTGRNCPPYQADGNCVVRFLIPAVAMKADPRTAALLQRDAGRENVWYVVRSADRDMYLLQTPCRDGTLVNFSLMCLQSAERHLRQRRTFKRDAASLRVELEGYHPAVKALADLDPEVLQLWPGTQREPLPAWSSGRLVLCGDACHPMQSLQGQGASQAIEDAGALHVLFDGLVDASIEAVQARLRIYEQVRSARASVVQVLSTTPVVGNTVSTIEDVWRELMPHKKLPDDSDEVRRWLWEYDVIERTRQAIQSILSGNTHPNTTAGTNDLEAMIYAG